MAGTITLFWLLWPLGDAHLRAWASPCSQQQPRSSGGADEELSSSLCTEVGGALALPPRRETGEVGAACLRGGCPT